MKRFPIDCPLNCKHYSDYDLSIDDIVACCDKLKLEMDLCDSGTGIMPLCPLTEEDKT